LTGAIDDVGARASAAAAVSAAAAAAAPGGGGGGGGGGASFAPDAAATWALLEDGGYGAARSLVVQFDDDPIDQSLRLAAALAGRFGLARVPFRRLRGDHLTPNRPSREVGALARAVADFWDESAE